MKKTAILRGFLVCKIAGKGLSSLRLAGKTGANPINLFGVHKLILFVS
jgi:hypothetical protein